jgi:hypothetical protein
MIKPAATWDILDLQSLIDTGAEEGASLEFKASAALNNNPRNKAEMVKDVSALANAAGGIIVYGVEEDARGVAKAVDEGAPAGTTVEWIEQVLSSNIEPQVSGLSVHAVPIQGGRSAFVIDVPKATVRAPHQSRIDQRYYRRWGRTTQRMFDHEVRDLMRRGDQPEIYLHWSIAPYHDLFKINIAIGNKSNAPALYGVTTIYLDENLLPAHLEVGKSHIRSNGKLFVADKDYPVNISTKNFSTPNHLPIFAEQMWAWFDAVITVAPDSKFVVGYQVACPGFKGSTLGWISRIGDDPPVIELDNPTGT